MVKDGEDSQGKAAGDPVLPSTYVRRLIKPSNKKAGGARAAADGGRIKPFKKHCNFNHHGSTETQNRTMAAALVSGRTPLQLMG